MLGFELVDVGLFVGDAGELTADTGTLAAGISASLHAHGLRPADLFVTVGATVEEIAPNQRERPRRLESRDAFVAAARIAAEIGAPGVTILPGVTWAENPARAWDACVEELAWRVDEASRVGVELRIEAHLGSIAPVPELVTKLCDEVPGLWLTFDVSHFHAQSVTLDRALTLAPLVRHMHVRASREGAVQVRWRDNEMDLATVLARLEQTGYAGAFCVEYVPMEKWRCDEMDVVTETLATRAALAALGVD